MKEENKSIGLAGVISSTSTHMYAFFAVFFFEHIKRTLKLKHINVNIKHKTT
jgi:hypothetical protein